MPSDDVVVEILSTDLTDTRVGGHRLAYQKEGGSADPAQLGGIHDRIDPHFDRVAEAVDPAEFDDGTVLARVTFEGDEETFEWVVDEEVDSDD